MGKLVIGIVGEKGSGKGTFPTLLQEIVPDKKIAKTTFSDSLTETFKVWSLPPTRENYIKLMVAMRDTFGPNVLANSVRKRIEDLEGDIVIVDGMRWMADLEMIRSLPNSKVLYITADPKVRYERTKARGQKAGETEASFEQFMKQETAATEVDIPKIAAQADFTINNNGTLEEFKRQTQDLLNKFLTK